MPEAKPAVPGETGFPTGLLWILCLLILGLYINGGLLYNLIYPSFQAFRDLDRYYQLVPYLATLALIWRFSARYNRRFTIYAGVALLGLGFVSFGLWPSSPAGYLLTETLILSAFAWLDVFVWTLLAEISELHGHTFRVFGFGLAVNVLALFMGGVGREARPPRPGVPVAHRTPGAASRMDCLPSRCRVRDRAGVGDRGVDRRGGHQRRDRG
ncbi:MAG: hypothetical protein QME79_07030 [Bacillota bacterium]|nr:hypothetical protein [Bacillota bacterium]